MRKDRIATDRRLQTTGNKGGLMFTIMVMTIWQRTTATSSLDIPSTSLSHVEQVKQGWNYGVIVPEGEPSERSQPGNSNWDKQQKGQRNSKPNQLNHNNYGIT